MAGRVRHYHHRCPFLQVVGGREGQNLLLVRQATEQGYIECEHNGVADLAYPGSLLRRARVKERGKVAGTLMAGEPSQYVFIDYGTSNF